MNTEPPDADLVLASDRERLRALVQGWPSRMALSLDAGELRRMLHDLDTLEAIARTSQRRIEQLEDLLARERADRAEEMGQCIRATARAHFFRTRAAAWKASARLWRGLRQREDTTAQEART